MMHHETVPPPWDDGVPGTIYLIHFDGPYHHARHYLGWTADLDARLECHARGNGSRLMAALTATGIGWRLVRTWEGATRNFERSLKKRKNGPQLCPICNPSAGRNGTKEHAPYDHHRTHHRRPSDTV